MQEQWFEEFDQNMDTVSSQQPNTVGGVKDSPEESNCNICFEEFPTGSENLMDCGCGHSFCLECWGGYISSRAEDASSCLRIDCPTPKCGRMVKGHLMAKVTKPEDFEKIKAATIANFVDKIGHICVCPGVDCDKYIKVHEPNRDAFMKDVRCASCRTDFCFNCLGEAHRPVISCDIVKQWELKNATDRANMDWIISHTKPCPSCKRPIEKNQGCMHMTCTRCGHHFCWLCLGDWGKHGESTGGYYNCRIYQQENKNSPEEKKRKAAESNLKRHLHFFERWTEHDKAMKILITAKHEWENEDKVKLSNARHIPIGALEFVSDAWDVVNRCRRVLKWTYVAAYFAFATDSKVDKEICKSFISDKIPKKQRDEYKAFFEFSQQEAEVSLERLSHKVETELSEFIPDKTKPPKKRKSGDKEAVEKDFDAFRNEVIGLSSVTEGAFQKMTQFLAKGLDKSIQAFN